MVWGESLSHYRASDRAVQCRTEADDAGVLAPGVHAVGEQDDDELPPGVDPQ